MIIYYYKNNILENVMKIVDNTLIKSEFRKSFDKAVDKIFSGVMIVLITGMVLITADMTTYDKREADRIIAQSK